MFSILLTLSLVYSTGLMPTYAASTTSSRIYLAPVATCCKANQTSFTVKVLLNLTASDALNVFDVRLNYSRFWSISTDRTGLLQSQSIDYTGNVFSSSPDVLFACLDAVQYQSQRCDSSPPPDSAGQVHFSEGGNLVKGPLSEAYLFSVTFSVHNNGTSAIVFDRSDIVNPSPDSSNPLALNPHPIPVLRYDGVFANYGLGAFFNYASSMPPAIVPGTRVNFDASMSFNATTNARLVNPVFDWNFGDGHVLLGETSPTTSHTFDLPGTYGVQLNITESGGASGSIFRSIKVVPALGTILLSVKNSIGSTINGGVLVQLFNSTSASKSFMNKTIGQIGDVDFTGLSPGNYYLNFTADAYRSASKSEGVAAGLTTYDTIYLYSIPPPSPNLTGLIVLAMVIAAGLILGAVAFVKRQRREKSRLKESRRYRTKK